MFAVLRRVWSQPKYWPWWVGGLVAVAYLGSRLIGLTALPVFADEAIYIRWAQLLRHDSLYLYFAMNDGKPPLFIWLVAGMLEFISHPLMAGRLVSVVAGLGQLIVSDAILQQLQAPKLARVTQAILIVVAPFWFFHHRMALMDALLVLWLSLSWLGVLILDRQLQIQTPLSWKKVGLGVGLGGLGWGLALWTKTPALFFSLVIVGWAYLGQYGWWQKLKNPTTWNSVWPLLLQRSLAFGTLGLLGLGIFALLRFQPSFGTLFGRSNDFTFTVTEILQGEWHVSLDNFGRFLRWMSTYFRPELLSLPFIALLLSRRKALHWRIVAGAALMALPFIVMGRTVHPRYYLPVAPFITASAALFVAEGWQLLRQYQAKNIQLVFWLLVVSFLVGSLRFMFLSMVTPNQTPFVLPDRIQYLTEWSSGHGITQVRDLMLETVATGQRVTVVTEGSFGTLPDGLLMYFDSKPEIEFVRIQGLEQYPVRFIPDWVWTEAADHPTWLVVNAHRLEMQDDRLQLKAQFPRPYGAPELEVYELHPK